MTHISKCAILLLAIASLTFIFAESALAGAIVNGPYVEVTDGGLGDFGNADHPVIASDGNNLYVVWGDTRSIAPTAFSNYETLFATSTDSGKSWSSNKIISDPEWDGSSTNNYAIAVAPNGTIFVAWYLGRCSTFGDSSRCGAEDRENDVRLAYSLDSGKTFQIVTLWDGDDLESAVLAPQITVDPITGIFYGVVDNYLNDQQHDIYLISVDASTGTRTVKQINDVAGSGRVAEQLAAQGLAIAAHNGVVCVAWEDSRNGNTIQGTCSTDKGNTFPPNQSLSMANGAHPRLAIAPDGTIHLAYLIGDNLFASTSTHQGTNWQSATQINNDTNRTFAMDMTVDANGTVAIRRHSVNGAPLYTSIDGGKSFATFATFGGDETALTSLGTGDASQLVWVERRHNNAQDQVWSGQANLDASLPTTPQNLQAKGKDRAITLTWIASSDNNGIASYEVLRSKSTSGPFAPINARFFTQSTFTDIELDGTTYFYKVLAVDGSGNRSVESAMVSAQATTGNDLAAYKGKIVYQSGSTIHLRDLSSLNQDRVLLPGLRPYFANDGNRLYYFKGSSNAILSTDLQGNNQQTLFSEEALTELYDVSTNGLMVGRVTIKEYQQFGNPLPCKAFEPRVGSLSGTASYAQPSAIVTDLALSPDGKWLFYRNTGVCNTNAIGYFTAKLCVVNLITSALRCQNDFDFRAPHYSPDSKQVVLAAEFSGQMEIWKADVLADGSFDNFVQMTHGAVGIVSTNPTWASDGSAIVFQRDMDTSDGVNWQLSVVQRDGAGIRSLGVSGETPAWFNGTNQVNTVTPQIFLPLVQK